MGMTLEGLLNSKKHDELDPNNMNGEDFMKKGDPVACLIQSGPKTVSYTPPRILIDS